MTLTWQPGLGVVTTDTRTRNARAICSMHGAGQQFRDSRGRLHHANGRFA